MRAPSPPAFRGTGMATRLSPREWIEPPEAFGRDGGTWRLPATDDEVVELMEASYLHEASRVVFEELAERRMDRESFGRRLGLDESQIRRLRRKLNGEFAATLADLLLWAAVLERPDLLPAPGQVAQLLPDGVDVEMPRLRG